MINNKRINICKIAFLLISMVLSLVIIVICSADFLGSQTIINLVSWIGVIEVTLFAVFWKKQTSTFVCIQNLFNGMFALFNFGQCFLWIFNIHSDIEIGRGLVFSSSYATPSSIIKAQLFFVLGFFVFNTAMYLVWGRRAATDYKQRKNGNRYLFVVSLIIAIISIPFSFYKAVLNFYYSQLYSYRDLYYGTIATSLSNGFIDILAQLMPTALLGVLIGSGYKKTTMVICYSLYSIYSVILLLTGDRGEWLIPFMFLLWGHFHYYKKLKIRTTFVLFAGVIVAISVISAIVSMRNTGLSWNAFYSALFDQHNNPFISIFTEYGHSMGIVILLIQKPITPLYGNTYLMTLPTLFGTALGNSVFGINYVQLHTWFPFEHLGINYGTDFSIIGEAYLNFGAIGVPICLFFEGLIIGFLAYMPYKSNKTDYRLIFSLIILVPFLKIVRSTFWLCCTGCIYSLIAFFVVGFLVKSINPAIKKRTSSGYYFRR